MEIPSNSLTNTVQNLTSVDVMNGDTFYHGFLCPRIWSSCFVHLGSTVGGISSLPKPAFKISGNKIAISTMWYEFYYQVIKGGKYPWVIQKMHEEHGKDDFL